MEAAFTDQSPLSRRNALMRFIDACGCEVEYDGYVIHLRKHRGSTVRKPLMDGENVTNLSVTIDGRENTAAYEISLFKMADLQAGDEVNITYTPMGIQADTRIVSIQYNPFYRLYRPGRGGRLCTQPDGVFRHAAGSHPTGIPSGRRKTGIHH